MEPTTSFLVAQAIWGGLAGIASTLAGEIAGGRADQGLGHLYAQLQERLGQYEPEANHDLDRAVYRAYLQASAQVLIKRYSKLGYDSAKFIKADLLPDWSAEALRRMRRRTDLSIIHSDERQWLEAALVKFSNLLALAQQPDFLKQITAHKELVEARDRYALLFRPPQGENEIADLRAPLVQSVVDDLAQLHPDLPAGVTALVQAEWFDLFCGCFQTLFKKDGNVQAIVLGKLLADLSIQAENGQTVKVELDEKKVSEMLTARLTETMRTLFDEQTATLTNVFEASNQRVIDEVKAALQSQPVAVTPFQVAAPVADFVGRLKELSDLTEHLQPKAEQTQTVAIAAANGTGGIGKTQLALKLVAALRETYPDAQLFINLRGVTLAGEQSVTPVEALQQFIRALEPAAQATQLPDDISQLRGKYLSLLQGQRALVVCDNARDRAQVEPLLPPAGCALIVTSRTAIALPGVLTRHLDKLAPAEAVALLQSIVSHLNEAAAAQLAALCGYFPQALRVYGNFLAERPSFPAERYAARIAEAQARGELEPEIAAAFETSYSELLNTAQQQHWRQLAVFVSDFEAMAAAAVWQLDLDEALAMLSELARRSLIEYDAPRDRYGWHDLARVYAQGLLKDDERYESEFLYAAHYCDVLESANELYLQGEPLAGLQRYDAERAHVAAGFTLAQVHLADGAGAAWLCMHYPDIAAYLLQLRLHPREQIEWIEVQLAAARQLGDRQGECNALGNLGNVYKDLGEVRQAIGCHEQDLAIRREISDRRGEGNALGNLGSAYYLLDEMWQAIGYFEQALAIRDEIGDQRGEGGTRGNLGLVYLSLGETYRAIGYFKQHLAIVREIGDRRGEGNALGNLGLANEDLGEVQEAIEYYEQALLIVREIGDRPGEAIHCWNLALVLHSEGKTEGALTLAHTALQLFEALESPHAAEVRAMLAEWDAAA